MIAVTDIFSVKFNEEEGALLRLVGLIERRQFTITGLVFKCHDGQCEAIIRTKMMFFEHVAGKPFTFHQLKSLFSQIEKMNSVISVKVVSNV